MITPKVGFIVFGVHKDGLLDPMGQPFIDAALVQAARRTLLAAGLELVEHDVIVATKQEARDCLNRFKKRDDVDRIVLFWALGLGRGSRCRAARFCHQRQGHTALDPPRLAGLAAGGRLGDDGAVKEIGVPHRFVYASCDERTRSRPSPASCAPAP